MRSLIIIVLVSILGSYGFNVMLELVYIQGQTDALRGTNSDSVWFIEIPQQTKDSIDLIPKAINQYVK